MSAPAAADAGLALQVKGLAPEDGVQALLEHVANLGVSDLFFCSNADHVAVLARHLGMLRPVTKVSVEWGRRCMTHIKALAGMDVAERRRPLDGRWLLPRDGKSTLDLRISTLPTMHGEDFTIRLLDRESRLLTIEQLGLLQRDYNQLLAGLASPSGLIVVTGPTGAGKTTTLYACLRHLLNGERKINTIEDPVEYSVEGVRQSQVNPRIDVGFPELLRSVLRQAPDVIMIGEIRDPVTAETAVRAANSGHLVLATLHAPVASGAIAALLNLGVQPHFLASALLGSISQRLVRTLCRDCKQGFDLSDTPHTFAEVKRYLLPGQGDRIFGPGACLGCKRMGYTGRTGVFEMLTVTPAVRKLILERAPSQAISQKANEEGLIPFRHAALLKVAQGETSIEEIFRAIPTEYLGVE
jgi:type II secretory ATPase GspE/PulE/Tfp pilus assembly ATPase PilB-like protein